MKCLEKDRARRYETANGLAMDVQRYLADEQVLASPPSTSYRLRKFLRKHRGPVLAASVITLLLVGSAVSTSLGLFRAERLRQLAEEKEREALDEKAKAEASQQQAIEALRATTDDVIERLIGAKPTLGPAEKDFLEKTLKRWQTFAVEKGEGELAQAIRAEGVFHVAVLRQELGQNEEALAGFEEAVESWKKLASAFPAVPQYRQDLTMSYNNLGLLFAALGQRQKAETAYRQALAIGDELAVQFPGVYFYRQGLARSHHNLAILLAQMGKRPEAEAAFGQALTIREKLVADFPLARENRRLLAGSYDSLGGFLGLMGKRPEAEAAIRHALAIYDQLVTEVPDERDYRAEWAQSHNNLGNLLRNGGKWAEAETAYRQALTITEKLAANFPLVPRYRQGLAHAYNNLGVLFADRGRLPEAEAAFRRALTIQEKLAADFPAVTSYYIELGGRQSNFGHLLRAQQRPAQALEWFAKAIATLEGTLRQMKVDIEVQQNLRNAHAGRAQALDDLKRHAEAAADWDKAVELTPAKDQVGVRMDRALSRIRAGQVNAALKDAEELAKNAHPVMLYNAACVFALAADRQDESRGSLSKEDCAKRAVALLQQAVAGGFKDAEHVKKDDDLKALRERDDFKKLVAELEKTGEK